MFGYDIHPLIAKHGYTAVFAIVMLEGAGSPLPGETALVLAAVYAGATGALSLPSVIGCAIAGAIIGGSFGFWFGRNVGAGFLERYGRYVGLTETRLALGHYLFERHGAKIVFFGRFIPILRVLGALLAGLNKYPWRSFFLFNTASSIAWATIMGLGGYFFGDAMTRVSGPLGAIALALVAASIFGFWLVLRRQEKKFEENLTAVALQETSGEPRP